MYWQASYFLQPQNAMYALLPFLVLLILYGLSTTLQVSSTQTHAQIHTHTHKFTAYTHANTYAYTHTNTHTHTHVHAEPGR